MKHRMMIRGLAATAFAITATLAGLAAPAAAAPPTTVQSMVAAANSCSTEYHYLPNKAKRIVSMSVIECQRTYRGKKQSSTAMWLWDNKAKDKKCAYGKTVIPNGKKKAWSHTWHWCNAKHGSGKYISGWHNGADAKIYLWAGRNKNG
jgi:hypothetical protein